jgi:hypothetical protein
MNIVNALTITHEKPAFAGFFIGLFPAQQIKNKNGEQQ